MTLFHLAQMNLARLAAPLDDPRLADFVAALDRVNALADRSPGFVWRLQGADGNATDLRPYPDERILVNMSVWESVAALRAYVYRGDHAGVLRRRREWFEPFEGPFQVLWWIPAGHTPTPAEGKARLEHLAAHRPTARAFSFKVLYPAEAAAAQPWPGAPVGA
jgi:hypothetical protein